MVLFHDVVEIDAGTHTLTMKKGKRHRPKENKKPQKDFMACCQKTREQN